MIWASSMEQQHSDQLLCLNATLLFRNISDSSSPPSPHTQLSFQLNIQNETSFQDQHQGKKVGLGFRLDSLVVLEECKQVSIYTSASRRKLPYLESSSISILHVTVGTSWSGSPWGFMCWSFPSPNWRCWELNLGWFACRAEAILRSEDLFPALKSMHGAQNAVSNFAVFLYT